MSVSSIERPKEGRPSRRHPEDSPDARRSFGQGQDLVREGKDRTAVSGSVQRLSLDGLVHLDIREKHQARTSTLCPVLGHGDQGRAHEGLFQGSQEIVANSRRKAHAETEVWDKLNGDLRAFRHAGKLQLQLQPRQQQQQMQMEDQMASLNMENKNPATRKNGDGRAKGSSTCEGAECQERAGDHEASANVSTEVCMPDLD